jgi:iron complex outermembrane recepter protein
LNYPQLNNYARCIEHSGTLFALYPAFSSSNDNRLHNTRMHKFQTSIRAPFHGPRTLISILLTGAALWSLPIAAQEPEALDEFVGFAGEDPDAILPTQPLQSVFGFSKSILETPRSISSISAETIDRMALTAVEDLVRVVPGVFTTTRFGIQGGIDVRNVTADTYFRGMRRLSLQGNARSVLAALDSIEVIKGPPSPIFGMGKIGGYTNVVPKSGRARTGEYLEKPEGFLQAIAGNYGRREVSFGVGGPVDSAALNGGYYIYGLMEDSQTFSRWVPVKQKILQGALSLADVFGKTRLETGFSYQLSESAGALTTRVTQQLIDDALYIRGTPLVNLDLNGNGQIGIRELFAASPVRGNPAGSNLPLLQNFTWPRDANGKPLPIDQFPKIAGIPVTMYNYLIANPDKDPTGLLRAQGVGGPLPNSGQLPVGFVLDPTTVGFGNAIHRNQASYEKEVQAELITAYLDLINDSNPDFTVKNQIFVDMMNQHKFSNQPVSRLNDILVLENKLTVSKRFERTASWLDINSLASANFRYTQSKIQGLGGDYGASRIDALDPRWEYLAGGTSPNTNFATPIEDSDYLADGTPFTNRSKTWFTESGIGVLFDIGLFQKANLLIGGRYDYSEAKNTNRSGIYAFGGAGTSASNPMRPITSETSVRGADDGFSYSVSLSYKLPGNIVPYVTMARSSVALDDSSNAIANNIILGGHMGHGELLEAGVKASFFDNKLFTSLAFYEQKRTDVRSLDDDPALINAFASSTTTRGFEFEIKWVPSPRFNLTSYVIVQETEFVPNRGANQRVDARTLGFMDVVDPATGAIIYPAEAFLYGGHAQLALPNDLPEYKMKAGSPKTQAAINASYTFSNKSGFTLSANYFSSVYTGRLRLVQLPEEVIYNAGAFYSLKNWDFKVDVFNLTNERYFKARTGDTSGDFYIQAMPDLRYQFTARYRF